MRSRKYEHHGLKCITGFGWQVHVQETNSAGSQGNIQALQERVSPILLCGCQCVAGCAKRQCACSHKRNALKDASIFNCTNILVENDKDTEMGVKITEKGRLSLTYIN